jgi:hypothetical protein
MAASLYSILEIQSLADPLNSGVFDTNTTMATNLVCGNGLSIFPFVSSTGYTFQSADIGHWLYLRSGTNWLPGWYQITALIGSSAVVNANWGQSVAINNQSTYWNGIGSANSLSSGTWSIDYTQSATARTTFSDLIINSSTVIANAGNSFNPAMVGNSIRILGGNGFTTGIYVINSVIGSTASLDRSPGIISSTGGSAYLGGAFPDFPTALIATTTINDKCIIYAKADATYNHTTDYYIRSTVCIPTIIGYGTYRYDQQKVNITIGSGTTVISYPTYIKVANLSFDGIGNTNTYATINSNNGSWFYNCEFQNMTGNSRTRGRYIKSIIKNVGFMDASALDDCIVTGCTAFGNTMFISCNTRDCLIYNNTATTHMFRMDNGSGTRMWANNTFYNNNAPFLIWKTADSASTDFIYNNLFVGNGGTVFQVAGGHTYAFDMNTNAYYNNGNINSSGPNELNTWITVVEKEIILSGDPFINAAGGDFRINDIAGAGKSVKNNGLLPQCPYFEIPNYMNIGVVQSKDPYLDLGTTGGMS